MRSIQGACLFVGLLYGCATSPIPEGYAGPTATIRDWAVAEGSNRARFFYVSEVDGKTIRHSLGATRAANSGRGFSLSPVTLDRKVPAKLTTLKMEGRSAYGAPIQEILNSGTMYSVVEVIEVQLKPDGRYVVRGELDAQRQTVWLEDEVSGAKFGRTTPGK